MLSNNLTGSSSRVPHSPPFLPTGQTQIDPGGVVSCRESTQTKFSTLFLGVSAAIVYKFTAYQIAQDLIDETVFDVDKKSVAADINKVMKNLKDRILSNKQLSKKLQAKGRDAKVYAPIQAFFKNTDQLLESWNASWSIEDTSGLLLDLSILLTRDEKDKAVIFPESEFKKLMEESKGLAKTPGGSVARSQWAQEFTPEGTRTQSGVSSTTLKLLYLLSEDKTITLTQIEAVLNGVCAYWKNSLIKQASGQYHTTAEAWASYNHFLLNYKYPVQ